MFYLMSEYFEKQINGIFIGSIVVVDLPNDENDMQK